jgi:hypothetical protein
MPYKDEQLDEGRGLLRVWTGVITASEVMAASSDDFATDDWIKLEYYIADYSGVTEVQATTDELRKASITNIKTRNQSPAM